MSRYLSEKLRLISFICIVLVLYIHSNFHYEDAGEVGMMLNSYLQQVISGMIGGLAVPMFFAISGFLFFRGTEESIKTVYQKLRRRVRTLVIPFILAAMFLPSVFLILKLSGLLDFMFNKSIQYLSDPWWMLLCRIFVFNLPDNVPFAVQLWFLRDLIVVMCFTPLLWRLKRMKFGWEILMLLLFVLSLFDFKYLPIKAFFWFCFGARFLPKLEYGSWATIGLLLYTIVSLLEIAFPNDVWNYFEIPMIALGVLSTWAIYDRLVPESFSLTSHKKLDCICQGTFYIYLYQLPLLLIVGKLIMLVHPSSWTCALAYLFSPWITIASLVVIALMLQKFFPRFYSVLVGGRVFNRSLISPNNP